MRPVGLDQLAGWVGGRVVEAGTAASTAVGPDVVIDSRAVTAGALFVALAGERADGQAYVASAHAAGAAASLVRDAVPDAGPQVVVADPVRALADLGRAALGEIRDRTGTDSPPREPIRVVGITGSSGKTSVKDLLAQVLAGVGPTIAAHGSFNNELGVPLTALRVEPDTRFLVTEMGARGLGHIRYLCAITPPDVAVVLNVGSAHLGEFGSPEVTAQAKGELVEALDARPRDGSSTDGVPRWAVLNASDPRVAAMATRSVAPVIWFADVRSPADPGGERAVWATDVRCDDQDRPSFTLHVRTPDGTESHPVALRVSGRHQVSNALAAAAAAVACGLSPASAAHGLRAAAAASRWRMEITERSDGTLLVNDAYNANPDSMAAALETLAAIGARRGRPTVAVLGDMLELGPTSASAHHDLGRSVVEHGIGRLVTVGDLARGIAEGARAAGLPTDRVLVVQDRNGLAERLAGVLDVGTVVLVKASRGVGLETVADALLQQGGSPAAAAADEQTPTGAVAGPRSGSSA